MGERSRARGAALPCRRRRKVIVILSSPTQSICYIPCLFIFFTICFTFPFLSCLIQLVLFAIPLSIKDVEFLSFPENPQRTSTDTKRPSTASRTPRIQRILLWTLVLFFALFFCSLLSFSFLYLVKYTRFSGELLSSQSAIISRLNSAQRYILSVRYILPTPSLYLYLPLGLFNSSLPFVRLLPLYLTLRLLPLSYSFLMFIFIFSVR